MAPLWRMFNVGGQEEPFLDNPRLFILNPKKRGKTKMKRSRRTRRASVRRRTSPRRALLATNRPRRRRSRRAFAANPPRRHHRRHTKRASIRRGFRRNPPDLLGFKLKDIAIAGAAVIAAPFLEKQLMSVLPASITGTKYGRYGVKIATAALVGYGLKRSLGGNAANLALIALGANIVADIATDMVPQLVPAGQGMYLPRGMGYYPPGSRFGLGAGPRPNQLFTGVSSRMALPMTATGDPFTPGF